MAKLIYLEADEEITEIIARVRGLPAEDGVVLVLPPQARALQSSLNLRLLLQYSQKLGKTTAIVTSDPRTQSLALEHDFATFPSVDAWERGATVPAPARAPTVIPASPRTAAAVVPASGPAATAVAEPVPTLPAPVERPREAFRPAFVRPARPKSRAPLIAAGAALGLAIIAAALYVPSASLTLVVAGSPVSVELKISGSKDAVPAGATAQIQTTPVEVREFKGTPVPATGVKTVPAVAGTGNVVFSLQGCVLCEATIPEGWIVSTANGIKFKTQKTVHITPITSPSSPIPIAAVDAGAAGNVEADKITQIQGNENPNQLRVRNPNPTTGGADAKSLTIVSAEDEKKAEQALVAELEPKVKQQLAAKSTGTLKQVGDATLSHDTSFDRNVGDETANFNASVTVVGKAALVDEAAVRKLLRQAINGKVPPKFVLTDDPIKTDYKPESVTPEGNVLLAGKADAVVRPDFSLPELRTLAKGKSAAEARQALSHLGSVQEVRVRQEPVALPRLPLFGSRIFFKVRLLRALTGTA